MGELIFISYSNQDRAYVSELIVQMEAAGMRPWTFEREQVPIKEYIPQLKAVIRDARAVLVVMSQHSMDSVPVIQELHEALAAQKQIIPLLISDHEGSATFLLRPFHWIDARVDRFPINQILRGLSAIEDFPVVPVILLDALDFCRQYVRPSELEVQVPLHIWSSLQANPDAEPQEICSIGAAAGKTMVIHPSLSAVSRDHARIKVRRNSDGSWSFLLCDNSKNGTWVNGELVSECRELQLNDLIEFPDQSVVLRFAYFDRKTGTRPRTT